MEKRHRHLRLEPRYIYKELEEDDDPREMIDIATFFCCKDYSPGGFVLENTYRFTEAYMLPRDELRSKICFVLDCVRNFFENDNEMTLLMNGVCSYAQLMPKCSIRGTKRWIPCIMVMVNLERWRRYDNIEAAVMARAVAESESMEMEEYRAVPATKAIIEGLEKVKPSVVKGEQSCCVICLEDHLPVGLELTRLPCTHVFHGDCIVEWLQKCNICPLCRFRL